MNARQVYREIKIKELEDRIYSQYLILLLMSILFLLASITLFFKPGTAVWKPALYGVLTVIYSGYGYLYFKNARQRFSIMRVLFYVYLFHTGFEIITDVAIMIIKPGELGRDLWTKGKGLIFAWIYLAIQFLYPILRIFWIGYFVWVQRQFTQLEKLKNQH